MQNSFNRFLAQFMNNIYVSINFRTFIDPFRLMNKFQNFRNVKPIFEKIV